MNGKIEEYIERILRNIELNNKNRNDLKREFSTHLYDKVITYKGTGLNEKQAIDKALIDFGDANEVGKDLAKSMIPLRKIFLIGLLFSSVIFAIITSVLSDYYNLFPSYTWLGIDLVLTAGLLIFIKRPFLVARHRMIFLFYLFILGLLSMYGLFLAENLIGTGFLGILRVLYCMVLLFLFSNLVLGAIQQPINVRFTGINKKTRAIISISNVLSGFFLVFQVAIFLLAFMIFGSFDKYFLLDSIPVLLLIGAWFIGLIISHFKPNFYMFSCTIQAIVSLYIVYTTIVPYVALWFGINLYL